MSTEPTEPTEPTAPAGHRSGCSHPRTGKCICAYLAQWDKHPGYTAPTFTRSPELQKLHDFTEQMSAEGRIISIDTLPGRVSEWDGLFKDPGTLNPRGDATGNLDERCTKHEHSWHFVKDHLSCEEWDDYVLGADGFSEVTYHPDAMVRLTGLAADRRVRAAELRAGNAHTRTKHWREQARHWQKGYWFMAAAAVAGWGFAAARGVWGF